MPFVRPCLWAALALAVAHHAAAQECRHVCRMDETRDANDCCVPRASTTPPVNRAPPRPVVVRCPAGTAWSETDRVCTGRAQCPAGSHYEDARGCVADAVACPTGTRPDEGRCIADITCPPPARLQGSACVSDVTCPEGTRLENNLCVSSDVHCPEHTHPRDGGGCVGDPICPEGTRYTEGTGCVGSVVCPPGTHLAGETCAPDVVCVEGTHNIEGRGCVDVCEGFVHTHWESERRACVCVQGFSAQNGACVEVTSCEAGKHLEAGQCVNDVICP